MVVGPATKLTPLVTYKKLLAPDRYHPSDSDQPSVWVIVLASSVCGAQVAFWAVAVPVLVVVVVPVPVAVSVPVAVEVVVDVEVPVPVAVFVDVLVVVVVVVVVLVAVPVAVLTAVPTVVAVAVPVAVDECVPVLSGQATERLLMNKLRSLPSPSTPSLSNVTRISWEPADATKLNW
jgi:hypothetical protein